MTGGFTFPSGNPATGEHIDLVPDAGPQEMAAAVAAARHASDATDWARDHAGRVRALRDLHDALVAAGPAMRDLLVAEAGVPVSLTTGPQYDDPVARLAAVAGRAQSLDWDGRRPAGVVAAITTWDFPVAVALAKVGPALAAGCTVVLKPAADAALVGRELGRIAAEVLPPGVLEVVTTRDVDVVIGLTTDDRVDLVSLSGSQQTGDRVRTTAANLGKRAILELGGKSAAVVLDDADLEGAVRRIATSVAVHAGQSCAVTTRLVVPRDLYDDAVEVAAATMRAIGVGDPTDPATVCGPVVSPVQRDRVRRYLALAEAEGGRLASGGGVTESPTGGGWWVAPAVVAGLANEARVAQEEVFGPVLTVIAHDGDDDAVRIADDSSCSLSASVDGADLDRARAVATRLRAADVRVNQSPGASGLGREHSAVAIKEYLAPLPGTD
jgi:aldehyde dehydrogenase (NAD+)